MTLVSAKRADDSVRRETVACLDALHLMDDKAGAKQELHTYVLVCLKVVPVESFHLFVWKWFTPKQPHKEKRNVHS
jgi:hypothetical protein